MWDNETQRLGMKKCWPLAYAFHVIGELLGFLGMLAIPGAIGCVFYINNTTDYSWETFEVLGLIIGIPLTIGICSELMVRASWIMVGKRNFEYDHNRCEATWKNNGEKVVFKSS